MKKIIISSLLILPLTFSASKADYCEWPCFTETKSQVSSKTNKKRTKITKQRNFNVRDIPLVGDVVRAVETGIASFYWQPQAVACGGRFNPSAMTAAHKSLPCGSKVRVTNKKNGRSVVVTINDRGPYVRGRIIDLSKAAAQVIGMTSAGLAPVSVERF